jgi:Protein of unknown function (DUF3987)/Bifunctional DNA primase/polymerase, N-terminal
VRIGRIPPDVPTAHPSGGYHIVFRPPPGVHFQTRSYAVDKSGHERFAIQGFKHIDIRAEGGLFATVGTAFKSGTYEVTHDLPVAECPPWLCALLSRAPDKVEGRAGSLVSEATPAALADARRILDAASESVSGCGGNENAYRVACAVTDHIPADDALELMFEGGWNDRCAPPWEYDELQKIVVSASNSRQSPIGSKAADVGFEDIEPPPGAPEPRTGEWPEPDASILRANIPPAPRFPIEAFGPGASWIEAAARAKGAPPDYVGTALLTVAAPLIGTTRRVEAKPGWSEPAILWAALNGPPSSNKSPATDAVIDILNRIEARMATGFEDSERTYEAAKRTAKIKLEAWEGDVRACTKDKRPLPPRPPDSFEPPKPSRPRVRVGDATIEAALSRLAENPRGLLMYRDELAAFLESFDRYGAGSGSRPTYLEAYGGRRNFFMDRAKDGGTLVRVPHLSLSILGTIQPDKVARLLTSTDDDGLFARFLISLPNPVPARWTEERVDDAPMERALTRLSRLQFETGVEPRTIPLSTLAKHRFVQWWEMHGARWEGICGREATGAGKRPGQVLRAALVLEHLSWALGTDGEAPAAVSERAIEAAITIIDDYFGAMLSRVLGGPNATPESLAAATLARWILKQRTSQINLRDIGRKGTTGLDSERLDTAVDVLAGKGWLRRPKREGGGRPPKDYDINPRVFDLPEARKPRF